MTLPYEEERPVGWEGGELFEATEGLRRKLDRVGDHIVGAANAETSRSSMTFLISGEWGVGKSSALRYIEDYARERVGADDVIFAWYRAPQHAARPERARASLLYEVILALQSHPDADSSVDLLLRTLGLLPKDRWDVPDERDRDAARRMGVQRALAEALGNAVDVGPVLEEWLSGFLASHTRDQLTTVVLIDDLDRCNSTEFVKELLVATQHWGRVANHFFIIAADENRVRRALEEHLVDALQSEDRGLSKYVHHTIPLPSQIPSREHAARLFGTYLTNVRLHRATRTALRFHLDNSSDTELGVLDPLLLGCGPRTLKARFNSLVSALDRRGADGDEIEDVDPSDWTVKRAVLQVRWPQEFQTRIQPAEFGDPGQIARFEHLLSLGRHALLANPRDIRAQELSVKENARASGLVLDEADSLLALYLASTPVWTTVDPEGKLAQGLPHRTYQPTRRRRRDAPRPEQFEPTNLPRLQELNEMLNMVDSQWTTDLDHRLEALRVAADQPDPARLQALFTELAPAIDAVPELPPAVAPILGGVAAAFATAGLAAEALFLHVSAYRANPRHANVAHNLVDFVLDRDIAGMYPMAQAALHSFDNTTTGASLRQRMLQLRMDQRLGHGTDNDRFGQLVDEATAEGAGVSRSELIELLEIARDLSSYDNLPKIGSVLLDRERGDLPEQAATVRFVADAMGASPDAEREEYAAVLYRGLMLTGLVRHLSVQGQNHILQNLASLSSSRMFTRPAAYVLWCALLLDDNQDLRTRLARAVNRLGDAEGAEDLLSAQVPAARLPAPTAPPFDQPLFPPCQPAQAWFDQHFPEPSYGDPLAPEVWQ